MREREREDGGRQRKREGGENWRKRKPQCGVGGWRMAIGIASTGQHVDDWTTYFYIVREIMGFPSWSGFPLGASGHRCTRQEIQRHPTPVSSIGFLHPQRSSFVPSRTHSPVQNSRRPALHFVALKKWSEPRYKRVIILINLISQIFFV